MPCWKGEECFQGKLQGGCGILLVFYKEQGFAALKRKKNWKRRELRIKSLEGKNLEETIF